MFGSLGSQGEHCLDLPTYLSSIGSSATCLVPVFGSLGSQGEHCLDLPTYLSSTGSLATCLVRAGLVSGLLFFEFEICLFGRLATCVDHLDRSLLWEKNATPCELFFITSCITLVH